MGAQDTSKPPSTPLIGERIVTRPYEDEDAFALHAAIAESRPALRPWMPWADQHATVEDSLNYIKQSQVGFLLGTDFSMGTFLRSDGMFLGGTGLHVRDQAVPSFEIGYWVRTSEEGKGYVSEAVRLLTTCAFTELGAQRVTIRCDARNERSRNVAMRQGYVFEGRLRNFIRDTSANLADMMMFAMTPEDFERARLFWK